MISRLGASVLLAMVLVVVEFGAGAQDRMPPLQKEQLTDEQAQALAEFVAARGQPTGPWNVLLRSPELMKRTRGLSDYLRFESVLPGYLREFAILMTARQWGQNYEWNAHLPLAVDEGFSAEMAQAIAEGRRPDGMLEDEATLYDFVLELQRNHGVSDATYDRARERFGDQGVVETVSLVGYYTMIAMLLNTARTPLPPGAAPALAPFAY